ncbi:ankyrin repeat domain-containing protein [Streptomyces sp. HNM0663]|uniref:Ankyrin repeat domain-containing protein n=1 Tax=Streptomyces chengmaiensis TaxID=3040919 RepID=A0ABT6HUU8_9ACTN|nr:ankyrin repeat domain-containing protein [Streptomyces chengmaiensis]MDH2392487.1 ankyrin repeat domain-containing protein [Streptomyces chengmaiensis]
MSTMAEFERLARAHDMAGIESARSEVGPDHVPQLAGLYWTLPDWISRVLVADLLAGRSHPAADEVLRDVLRAPLTGHWKDDWIDIVKIGALGHLDEEHADRQSRYFSDREALHRAVEETLARLGLSLDAQPQPQPQPEAGLPAAAHPLPEDPEAALAEAAKTGRLEDVRRLLAGGVSPHITHDSDPLLLVALRSGQAAVALALLQAGADAKARRATGGQSALGWAAFFGCTDVVEDLLRRGAPVNAVDQYGQPPLSNAAANGHAETVRALLRAGADPLAQWNSAPVVLADGTETVTRRCVLQSAVRGGRVEIVDLLLAAGAQRDADAALQTACVEGSAAVVRRLLAAGADAGGTGSGPTPLMRAAGRGLTAMVRALLEAGADPTAVRGGRTAQQYAKGARAEQIRALLATARPSAPGDGASPTGVGGH